MTFRGWLTPFLPWGAVVLTACSSAPDPQREVHDASALALSSVTSRFFTDSSGTAVGTNVAGPFWKSEVGQQIVDTFASVIADPRYGDGGQGIGTAALPSAPRLGGGIAAGSQQGGTGGLGSLPLDSQGLPGAPSGSLHEFASLLCAYTVAGCDQVLHCSRSLLRCGDVFSATGCAVAFEEELWKRGVRGVPSTLVTYARCLVQSGTIFECTGGGAATPSSQATRCLESWPARAD